MKKFGMTKLNSRIVFCFMLFFCAALVFSQGPSDDSGGNFLTSSWDFPLYLTVGTHSDVPVIHRTLRGGEEEYFLLEAPSNGRLTLETTGSLDMVMELYDADTGAFLGNDDDSGESWNARMVRNVEGGRSYMVLVSGYSESVSGDYGFRAYIINYTHDNSWDAPIPYTVGANAATPSLGRFLEGGEEDYFLINPQAEGYLIVETTGSTDTYMELYDAYSRAQLAYNDDGGQGLNARIRYFVEPGQTFIAMVRGYGSWTSGEYAFRAFIQETELDNSWTRPLAYTLGQDDTVSGITRWLDEEGEDFFLLVPSFDGILTAETTGSTDTYMELYDAETRELLAEDDDSGQNWNAQIRYTVSQGRAYIALVRGYGYWASGEYTFRAYVTPAGIPNAGL
ncbi:MAG: hypothetical protein FWH12_02150 [Treponema sp.]|nr:hypothetical protein [Treponema sp.]